jgi:hypothetical protein
MKYGFLLLLLLCSVAEASSARNKIADACSELTNRDAVLTKNCVNHAELFELDSEFIRAVVGFHRSVDVRMMALKSGASVDTLKLCRSLGWNLDNTLSCLRAYPTPEIVKACKKVGAKEEDQLRCVREGRETAQIDACVAISPKVADRLSCLELDVPAMAIINCENKFHTFKERLRCMEKETAAKEDEYRRDQREMKDRVATMDRDPAPGDPLLVAPAPHRTPASAPTK